MRIAMLATCVVLLQTPKINAQNVNIGVLGIFRAQDLTLTPVGEQVLVVLGAGREIFVHAKSECATVHLRANENVLIVKCGPKQWKMREFQAASRNQEAADVALAVPGKIKRNYRGILKVIAKDGVLLPIVSMGLETAVASVVRAEMTEDTPLEALKAQAVATRSYFIAGGGRHADFDFCDLTHCQFLREPPPSNSPAAVAAEETLGVILTYAEKPFAAMYTRSCGGHTRTPKEIGMPAGAYPYFSVQCDLCYKNPVKWTRRVSAEDAALLLQKGEAGRLLIGRRLGWNAVPSNNFVARKHGQEVLLEGMGQGHGVGLCQRGAKAMGEMGASFREILEHYYPNVKIGPIAQK